MRKFPTIKVCGFSLEMKTILCFAEQNAGQMKIKKFAPAF